MIKSKVLEFCLRLLLKVSIICPIFNGAKYIPDLVKRIRSQENISDIEIIFPVTKSIDNSFKVALEFGDIAYEISNFSHSLTRHDAVLKSSGEYIVFITQDILPANDNWVFNLIKEIRGDIVAAYSRQIPYEEHCDIEKSYRKFNYGEKDIIYSLEFLKKKGRKALFFSDASSAFSKKNFLEIGGFNFDLKSEFGEDVLIANKILNANKKYIYSSNSVVFHSHNYSFAELFKRYKCIGRFEKEYSDIFKNIEKSEKEGFRSLKFVFFDLFKEKKIFKILELPFNFFIRYLGYKVGKISMCFKGLFCLYGD